jgi:molecular chaperone GrpE
MSQEEVLSQAGDNEMTANKEGEVVEKTTEQEMEQSGAELQDSNDRYLRLYAEFENYKKRVSRDKEELIRYGNENLLSELLPSIDHLEMALKHAPEVSTGLVQGVEITLKELRKTLEKFGLTAIEAYGRPFDPAVHHAMSQVERDDVDDNTVVEEFRKGYMLREKVLRPSLVGVSKKPYAGGEDEEEGHSGEKK